MRVMHKSSPSPLGRNGSFSKSLRECYLIQKSATYESCVKWMSFSSGTGGGLGGFQLICTAGCLALSTCSQEHPFSIASNKSPYLLISQSVTIQGAGRRVPLSWLCWSKQCHGACVKLTPSVHNTALNFMLFLYWPDPILDKQLTAVHDLQKFSSSWLNIFLELSNWEMLSFWTCLSAWISPGFSDFL